LIVEGTEKIGERNLKHGGELDQSIDCRKLLSAFDVGDAFRRPPDLGGPENTGEEGSAQNPPTCGVVEFARATMVSMPGGYDERWLQELLFAHPELIPIDRIEAGAGGLLPICRELTLAREGRVVCLDLLCLTRSGRLMLVECKLWRNQQARREVVAQILEYAALLRGWSYGDLTARLKQQRGWKGKNPIFDPVSSSKAAKSAMRFQRPRSLRGQLRHAALRYCRCRSGFRGSVFADMLPDFRTVSELEFSDSDPMTGEGECREEVKVFRGAGRAHLS
jgi:hypothetical protein